MKRIAIVFEDNIFDRKGSFNAKCARARRLQRIVGYEVDVYCIQLYQDWFVSSILGRRSVDIPGEGVITEARMRKRDSIMIGDLKLHLIWKNYSILDHFIFYKLGLRPVIYPSFLRRRLGLFKDFDLLSAHSLVGSILAMMVKKAYGIPFYASWHGSDIHTHPIVHPQILQLTADAIREADCNCFVSRSLLETSDGIAPGRKEVLYNGADKSFYPMTRDEKAKLKSLYGADGRKVVAFVGSLVPIKNPQLLPELFDAVQASAADAIEFWVVGDGRMRGSVERQMNTRGVSCKFWGNVPVEKMPEMMNCMDVLVLPSVNEGLPLVCVEAVRCGVSVVASRVGGIPEVAGDKNTFPLDEDFVRNASARISSLLKSPEPLPDINAFDWKLSASKEDGIIRSILYQERHHPSVSVICPVYNAEKYIRRGVDSILNQTFTDFELILVDDGSSDESGRICDEYAVADDRARVIHKPNGGVATARQTGMDAAGGEYFIHFDPDDWVDVDWLEKMVSAATGADADVTICDFMFEYGNKSVREVQCHVGYSSEDITRAVTGGKLYHSLCNKLIRRSVFDARGLFFPTELYTAEDAFVCHSLFIGGVKATFCPGPAYHYDRCSGTASLTRTAYDRSLEAIRRCVTLLEKAEGDPRVRARSVRTMKATAKMKAFHCLPSKEFRNLYKEIDFRFFLRSFWKVTKLDCYVALAMLFRSNEAACSLMRLFKKIHEGIGCRQERMKDSGAMIPPSVSDKVLLVGEYFREAGHGGIAAVLRSYAPCFASFRFVASYRSGKFKDKLLYDLGGLFKMSFVLLFHPEIRIVHIHTAAGGSFRNHTYYAKAAKMLGRKVILHSHASGFVSFYEEAADKRRASIRKTLNSVDRLVVLSRSWKDWFESIGVSGQGGRIIILNNITGHPQEPFVKPPKEDGRLRLLFLGEIGHRKGIFDVLEAISGHKGELAGRIEMKVCGNRETDRLQQQIEKDGLQGMVRFEGFVAGKEKAGLLTWADVLVLTSYGEGLPISILEAMSYGNAILSTPVGGIPEVVDESNGILVEPGDLQGIFNALNSLASMSGADLRAMGKAGRRKVEAFYPDAVIAHLREIYSSLLTG